MRMALVLAALSLLGLGIFGPGIANGLVSGGPQLGAGAAVGTGLAAGGAVCGRRRRWPWPQVRSCGAGGRSPELRGAAAAIAGGAPRLIARRACERWRASRAVAA